VQIGTKGGEDIGLEYTFNNYNLGIVGEVGETEFVMKRAARSSYMWQIGR